MDVKRHAGTGMIILAIALAVAVSTSSAGGLGHGNHKHSQSGPYPVPVCDPCVPPPWTVFEADKEFENLQIHVTGPGFNILEIYFKRAAASSSHAPKSSSSAGASSLPSLLLRWLCVLFCGASSTADAASPVPPADRFFVDPIDGASCLYANKSLALAPANEWGTFAVRYGPNQDTFKIYGWGSGDTPIMYGPYTLEPGYPVYFRWITSQILKVTCCSSNGLSKTLIVRFRSDAAGNWGWEDELYMGQP